MKRSSQCAAVGHDGLARERTVEGDGAVRIDPQTAGFDFSANNENQRIEQAIRPVSARPVFGGLLVPAYFRSGEVGTEAAACDNAVQGRGVPVWTAGIVLRVAEAPWFAPKQLDFRHIS